MWPYNDFESDWLSRDLHKLQAPSQMTHRDIMECIRRGERERAREVQRIFGRLFSWPSRVFARVKPSSSADLHDGHGSGARG